MTKGRMAGLAVAGVVLLLALGVTGRRALRRGTGQARRNSTAEGAHPSLLYGRVRTLEGGRYEGRLRWGGGEEAFWGDYFNGAKSENPWAGQAPAERLPKRRDTMKVFGFVVKDQEAPANLGRMFMGRFGDIARIEAQGRVVQVTLKSGTVFDLNRMEASDFDDGVRVWDGGGAAVDVDSSRIQAIELLPAPGEGGALTRLHGTVRTRKGDFTGFIQWNRDKGVGSDELEGRGAGGEVWLRLDGMRSIARGADDGPVATLLDGREIALTGKLEAEEGSRGMYVDDRRYGRVLVSWEAFERADFSDGGSGPAYGDFPPGRALTGSVTTRAGRRLAGRLVYDLDESETTETLDAPREGVDYTILFGLIASIETAGCGERGEGRARVLLHSGEELLLECRGDLGGGNGGMLVFGEGGGRPEYVPWGEVRRVELERPGAMYPAVGGGDAGTRAAPGGSSSERTRQSPARRR